MLFPTFDYFLFLPVVAALHWLLRSNGARTWWLTVVSLVFYTAWNPADTLLLLAVIGVTFTAGLLIGEGRVPRKPALVLTIVLLLAPMMFYKYLPFVTENIAALVPGFPVRPRQHLPIGISFYSFQAIAYVVDVYRGMKPERHPGQFACFLLFFPHLVAGPILRAGTLVAQIRDGRSLSRDDVGIGVSRLITGLVKKMLIADVLRIGVVDSVFTDPDRFTGPEVLVALYAYSLQIYADFSGYTDFAIGSARLLGFRIPENFDRPYQALSVANYWRRWHITLSDWVRDYVYYPLGGSRGEGLRPYLNTYTTLLILGVWHGANWTFVLYGVIHGTAVSINRWWKKSGPGRDLPEPRGFGVAWRWFLTFQFVVLARILFRAHDLGEAWRVTVALFRWADSIPRWSVHAWVVLALGFAAHFTPAGWTLAFRSGFARLPLPVQGLILALVGWLCVRFGPGDTLAFIYHDF